MGALNAYHTQLVHTGMGSPGGTLGMDFDAHFAREEMERL